MYIYLRDTVVIVTVCSTTSNVAIFEIQHTTRCIIEVMSNLVSQQFETCKIIHYSPSPTEPWAFFTCYRFCKFSKFTMFTRYSRPWHCLTVGPCEDENFAMWWHLREEPWHLGYIRGQLFPLLQSLTRWKTATKDSHECRFGRQVQTVEEVRTDAGGSH